MNTIKINSVPFNRVGLNVIGEIRSSAGGGGGGGDVPSYPNGVYIQHIDGKLYTTDEWTANGFANDVANGVAVVDEDVKFVLATVFVGSSIWAETTIETLQEFSDDEFVNDINGYANTQIILATGQNSAAKLAASYIFPNGNRGYLPSAGELKRTQKINSDIQSALQCLGKQNLSGRVWSSTRGLNERVVRYTIGGAFSNASINTSYYVWAATSL